MRVSFNGFFRTNLANLLNQQSNVNETAIKISTGKKIISSADDPSDYSQIVNFKSLIKNSDQFIENGDFAQRRLQTEDDLLGTVYDTLLRIRELQIQGGNSVLGPQEISAITAEMRERMEELDSLANFQDSNGEYIFAGFQSAIKPFTLDNTGSYTYNGDDGHKSIEIGDGINVKMSDSGFDVFHNIRRGNGTFYIEDRAAANTGTLQIRNASVTDQSAYVPDTYTITFSEPGGVPSYEITDSSAAVVVPVTAFDEKVPIEFLGMSIQFEGTPVAGDDFDVKPATGQSMFDSVQNIINTLESRVNNPAGNANFNNSYGLALGELDQVMNHILNFRSQVGARLNKVETVQQSNEDIKFQSQVFVSKLEDLDIAEAASELTKRTTALEAAQATFIRVQNLSIFNFL